MAAADAESPPDAPVVECWACSVLVAVPEVGGAPAPMFRVRAAAASACSRASPHRTAWRGEGGRCCEGQGWGFRAAGGVCSGVIQSLHALTARMHG
jgi:hypothetical protein